MTNQNKSIARNKKPVFILVILCIACKRVINTYKSGTMCNNVAAEKLISII